MEIKINENYGIGGKTVEDRLAWITPGSIFRLDELLSRVSPMVINESNVKYNWERTKVWNKRFKAVEFGCGGSTLFLSDRCKSVLSFEQRSQWKSKIESKTSNNVRIKLAETEQEIFKCISELEDFDVAFIDNDWKFARRDDIFERVAPKIKNKKQGIVVFDNYGSPGCFPKLYNKTPQEVIDEYLGEGWVGEDYDSIFWGGLGTRIFHKGIVEKKVFDSTARWYSL
jgi:hypothetical protein